MAALLVQEDERESPLLRDFPEEASFEDEALAPVPNPALEGFRAQDLRVSSSPGPDVRDTSEASIRVGYSNGGCPWCVHFIYDEYYMANLLSVLNSSWEDITRGSFSKCLSRLRDPSEEMLALGGPCCLRLSRIVKFLRAGDFFCHVPCWAPSPGIQARTRVEERMSFGSQRFGVGSGPFFPLSSAFRAPKGVKSPSITPHTPIEPPPLF
ncbi:hypothetical protein MJG53_012997 [Ovis ammon polii x Ovis aries]|uniref:Uncharacterized protein n=1 Tax=Ovis ammon polii x Ovis aries TaxID=2918886 RepID=A0ACB9UMC7_9CETA|nr:hypothetical protein MJG53_012997 [Ovis ammon polii x Ovis aries]